MKKRDKHLKYVIFVTIMAILQGRGTVGIDALHVVSVEILVRVIPYRPPTDKWHYRLIVPTTVDIPEGFRPWREFKQLLTVANITISYIKSANYT